MARGSFDTIAKLIVHQLHEPSTCLLPDFQRIVTKTITPSLLKWKGVETTQEIAKSPNSKVIVIGNGDGDLPIILGGDK